MKRRLNLENLTEVIGGSQYLLTEAPGNGRLAIKELVFAEGSDEGRLILTSANAASFHPSLIH